jgi:Zn-finger protein
MSECIESYAITTQHMDTKDGSSIKTCMECQLNLTANAIAVQNMKSIRQGTKVIRKVIVQCSSKMGCDFKSGPAQGGAG